MKVVTFNKSNKEHSGFLNVISQWWLKKTKSNLPNLFLTDYGFMVFKEDMPIVSCFLYPVLGCDSCIWALHCSSPESTKEERGEAIKLLCDSVCDVAKQMGFKAIVGYPKLEGITNRMVENGFVITETGANQCVKYIGG